MRPQTCRIPAGINTSSADLYRAEWLIVREEGGHALPSSGRWRSQNRIPGLNARPVPVRRRLSAASADAVADVELPANFDSVCQSLFPVEHLFRKGRSDVSSNSQTPPVVQTSPTENTGP
jgi:hypothetical protein